MSMDCPRVGDFDENYGLFMSITVFAECSAGAGAEKILRPIGNIAIISKLS